MPEMPYKEMAAMMQMNDKERVGQVLLDQFEWRHTAEGNAVVWEAQGRVRMKSSTFFAGAFPPTVRGGFRVNSNE